MQEEVSAREEQMAMDANDYAFAQRKQSLIEELKQRYATRQDRPNEAIREWSIRMLRRGVLTDSQIIEVAEALDEPQVQVKRSRFDGRPFA